MLTRTTRSLRDLLVAGMRSLPSVSPDAMDCRRIVLREVEGRTFRAPHLLRRYHDFLCFVRAYPDDLAMHRAACEALARFGERLRDAGCGTIDALENSGITGTIGRVEFPFESAHALARAFPGEISIDWDSYDDPARLEPLLQCLLHRAEAQAFDEGELTTRAWVERAAHAFEGTDFDWLMAQIADADLAPAVITQLYDHAIPPLAWNLDGSAGSITALTLDRIRSAPIVCRSARDVACGAFDPASLRRPPRHVSRVGVRTGQRLIDAAVATLAARGRDVYAFNYGNPHEVYAIDCGRGVTIVIAGVVPSRRLTLEANYGYVAFMNGVPVCYGGMTALFHQANTGVNVFEPYRYAGEAGFLFTNVLRACHALFDATHFVVNGYQIGQDNREAIDSGAYWFYHKLGFRPDTPARRALSEREVAKKAAARSHRTDGATLRALADGDVHLRLDADGPDRYFPEAWLERIALGVTDRLGRGGRPRREAAARLAADVARRLGVSRRAWPRGERAAFDTLAPIASLLDLERWPAKDRRRLARALRAKGRKRERDWVRAAGAHPRLRSALAAWCRGDRRA